MPFKSKAQRRKFAELLVKGEITPEAYERWNKETGRAELPERVKSKRKGSARKSKRCGARSGRAGRTPRGRLLGRKYSVGGRGRVAGAVQRRRGGRSLGNAGRLGCFGNAFWLIQWPGRGA